MDDVLSESELSALLSDVDAAGTAGSGESQEQASS